VARWLTPNGDQINEIGLTPDVEIKNDYTDEENPKDTQLESAIEIVKELR
jgi:C-terminal processing protease CtpA/Prc